MSPHMVGPALGGWGAKLLRPALNRSPGRAAASAAPMPRDEPVTIATLLLVSVMDFLLICPAGDRRPADEEKFVRFAG